MKIMLDIHNALLDRAKRHAKKTGRLLCAIVEDGLHRVLAAPVSPHHYQLPDLSIGGAGVEAPLEAYSWQDLRRMIYEKPETG